MRRVITIIMVTLGLTTVITGIWDFFPPFNGTFYVPHTITACIFGILVAVHLWLNRKPVLRYFKGLGRWWILVGLGGALVIWLGIIMPIFVLTGAFGFQM
jgi:hypothetical protein